MGNNKIDCDILNFEWGTNSRDTNIVEPVLCYLEKYYNLKIIRESYEMFMWKLEHIRPRMVLVSNYMGAKENVLLVKRANDLGIKTVSLISEGNIISSNVSEFFYGNNTERHKYIDLFLLWSERSKKLILDNIAEAYGYNIEVSGGTGFDRYKLFKFINKNEFLNNFNKTNRNVVGIASWGFDQIYDAKRNHKSLSNYNSDEIDYLYETRGVLNSYYNKLISNNPETLFVLKYHPGCLYTKEKTEFAGLDCYENTISICTEYPVSDIISASDFWISFDSTTNLEAWLLNKTTISIIPNGGNFIHSNIIDGNPKVKDYNELESAFNEFFSSGELKSFTALSQIRDKIIEDTIGFKDGMNYKRAGEFIYKLFSCEKVKIRQNKYFLDSVLEKIKEIRLAVIIHTPLGYMFKNVNRLRLRNKLYSYKDRIEERKKYLEVV